MKNLISACIGKISWDKPLWVSRFISKCKQNPQKTKRILWGIFGALGVGVLGYVIYQKIPKPAWLSSHLKIPAIVVKDHKQVPTPLRVVFNYSLENTVNQSSDSEMGDYDYASVAPLKQIGKKVTQGIEISPAIEGEWQWQSDKSLVFTPKAPWPAGTDYTLHFSRSLFDKTYRMDSRESSFTTIPLAISVQSFKFFQDLEHPQVYKASATLNFNYPIDPTSFSQNVKLLYPTTGKNVPFTVSYSQGNWQAYIQADIQVLPDSEQYLQLDINKNVKPLGKGNSTANAIQARLMIPDKSSVLKINAVNATIVRNDKGQPEQVITVETTAGITTEALAKNLQVYLLPRDYPAVGNTPVQKDYQWSSAGEVNDSMLTQKVEVLPIPTMHDYETLHSFKVHVEPNQFVYLTINKGLQSYRDYTLSDSYATILKAPEYPKEINFLHPGSLLALTGDKKISVIVRGLPAVKFTLARVLPDEINHLITQTQGDFQNPQFLNYSFDATNISTINTEIDNFDNSDPSRAQYAGLDLGKYLDQKSYKLGLFLVKAGGWDPQKKVTTEPSNNRLVLITDMDMLAKNDADGSRDIFVQSFTEGSPVSGAKVEVLGKNGVALMSQMTDAEGHVHFPSLKDFTDEKTPTVYVVSKGNDIAFMPYARADRLLNYSRFDTGGDDRTHKYGLNAFLFSDRGIYRPGETLHLGLIVKGNFAAPTVAGLPLELIMTDPRGLTVYDEKFTSNDTGLFSKDYHFDPTSLTGDYTASLYVTKDNAPDDLLGNTTLQVQEFEPDQLKIKTQFNPLPPTSEGWVSPQNLTTKVQLWNLFGTPAQHRRITGKLYFSPKPLEFSAYPDYVFTDPYRDPSKPLKTFSENLTDIQTDDKGQAQFNLDLSRYAQSTYQLTVLTQGFAAEGGRGVSQITSVLVSPLPYLIGFKPDGDLNYIRENAKRSVHFIAINAALKPVPVQNLHLRVIQLNSIITLAKQADGSYQYQTVIQEHQMSDQAFSMTSEGSDYTLPTDQIGNYKIELVDQNNLLLGQVPFSIIGQGEHALAKNATMTLKLDKKNYAPGDTIQLNITAPYNGWGLISIERDKVYAYKWFKMNESSSIESITIPKDFEGTGYVSVALIRDWNSDEIFLNPLSYNVQAFSVVPPSRCMNLEVNAPDIITPGKPLNITYSSDKPGNMIVYAVDEGILQVAGYNTPDPLGYYFQKRALSVDTSQIADQILPKYIANRELSAIGGGGEQKSIASNLNPFARKVAPVVYWSGILNVDQKPQQVTYQVPDYFNGTLRLMAVGVSPNAVGSIFKKIISKDDVILTPNVPFFVAPGDDFEVSVNVANTTNATSSLAISLSSSPLFDVKDNAQQSLTLPSHSEKTVTFKLNTKNKLGESELVFTAKNGNKVYQRKISLSVRPMTAYQTSLVNGYATSSQNIDITRQLYPEYRVLKAESSLNPLILVRGLNAYLKSYPYECTEQLVSRAFIALAVKNQPGFVDTEKWDETYRQIIQLLRVRQTSEGSFMYWPGGNDKTARPFATIYAAYFLTEAKHLGEDVPAGLLNHVISYLKDYAGSPISNMSDARLHAYAIYVLTRNDILTADYIANLQAYFQQAQVKDWQKDITGVYIAGAYQMLQNAKMADQLISDYKMGKSIFNDSEFFSSSVMDSQYIAILAEQFPDRLSHFNAKQLIPLISNLSSDQLNSLLAASSAVALIDYAKSVSVKNTEDKLSITAKTKEGQVSLDNAEFPADSKTLYFNTQNSAGYFYQVTQQGYDLSPPVKEIKSGLEVYREYQNDQGNPVTSTKLGDSLEVHLRIRSANNQFLNNIAIVDLLPGGFELVPHSIVAKDSASNLNYYDAREDRIVFYVSVTPNLQEYTYRIRAINKGLFTVPPVFATSMYNSQIFGESMSGKMVVG